MTLEQALGRGVCRRSVIASLKGLASGYEI